jgi:hypothetical protein
VEPVTSAPRRRPRPRALCSAAAPAIALSPALNMLDRIIGRPRTVPPGVRLPRAQFARTDIGCPLSSRRKGGVTRKVNGGGWGGIRTPGEPRPTPVFKTGAINHSATHPSFYFSYLANPRSETNRELSTIIHGSIGSPLLACHHHLHDRDCGPVVPHEQVSIDLEGHIGVLMPKAPADLHDVELLGSNQREACV